MERRSETPVRVASLDVAALPLGEIGPVGDPTHASWAVLAPWDDPLASREHARRPSQKRRTEHHGTPVIAWDRGASVDRALVTGSSSWRDGTVRCRVQALQGFGAALDDDPGNRDARAGLVFRMETVRRCYFFCVENQRRLVLYRRTDAEWTVLAACDVPAHERVLTLEVRLNGDAIEAACPEMKVCFQATDTVLRAGPMGFRALGECRLQALEVAMTPSQQSANDRLEQVARAKQARLERRVPDEVHAGSICLANGRRLLLCSDFAETGRNDLLFATPAGLQAETWEGTALWQAPLALPPFVALEASGPLPEGGRRLYALEGARHRVGDTSAQPGAEVLPPLADRLLALDGRTGTVVCRATLPASPAENRVRYYDLSHNTGRLAGDRDTGILVREWRQDVGNGGDHLWAFDGDLNLLWTTAVSPPYGHHNAVHCADVNGNGRDDILAGGALLSPTGEVLWVHDRADEMLSTFSAVHYDASVIGPFAGDAACDPVAFLVGGSAGVYVVDGLTGKTRAVHRIGHAQWCLPCRVRDDLPGTQVMAGTRWGNYGIITLFSGRGERLWTIQPDTMGQGARPVQWRREGPQHIWVGTSRRGMGLYDGQGRMVKPLDRLRALYGEAYRLGTAVLRRRPDGPDLLGLQVGDTLQLFGSRE